MSDDADAVALDERSFNLESVEMVDDAVDVHNGLVCEDRVGIDIEVNIDANMSSVDSLPLAPINEEKKKIFERQQDEILSSVPTEVKSRFGEIYFSTFGKFIGPVLIMNPFKVEPGPLRDQWLTMYSNCQKSGRETQMTHLTYWYGEFNDLRYAYSFQKTSQLLTYEEGMKITEKKLKTIQKKHHTGKKISSKETNFMKGFEEMEADRTKDPTERYGYVDSIFLEEYHITSGEDKYAIPEDQVKKKKTSVKSKKKKRIKSYTNEQPAKALEKTKCDGNGIISAQEKKVNKKRRQKGHRSTEMSKPKKKVKNSEVVDQTLENHTKSTTANVSRRKKVKDHDVMERILKIEDEKPSAYEEFTGLDEASSHGEADDGSIKMDELRSDDDSVDEDYVENPKVKTSKKTTLKKKAKVSSCFKSKELPQANLLRTKGGIEISTGRVIKKDSIGLSSKKEIEKEQQKFRSCEIKFLPLLRRWKEAINNKNATQLSRIYEELLTSMEHFTAPFILEYGMNDLMKRSKGYNNELRRHVNSRFKVIYNNKKDEVPIGFKATKESENDVSLNNKASEKNHAEGTNILKAEDSLRESDGKDTSHGAQDELMRSTLLSSSKNCNKNKNGEMISNLVLESTSQKYKRKEAKFESSSQKQNISSGKQEKKKFSLGKLMRVGSSSFQRENVGSKFLSPSDESCLYTTRAFKSNKNNPIWTIQLQSTENYLNENRSFGLEFLRQAIYHIPDNKAVNYETVARNIEIAVYKWSTKSCVGESEKYQEEQCKKYWNKIHDLAACISGKLQDGTIAKMIGDGKFASPDELVCLHDDDLWNSFEGSCLSKYRK